MWLVRQDLRANSPLLSLSPFLPFIYFRFRQDLRAPAFTLCCLHLSEAYFETVITGLRGKKRKKNSSAWLRKRLLWKQVSVRERSTEGGKQIWRVQSRGKDRTGRNKWENLWIGTQSRADGQQTLTGCKVLCCLSSYLPTLSLGSWARWFSLDVELGQRQESDLLMWTF